MRVSFALIFSLIVALHSQARAEVPATRPAEALPTGAGLPPTTRPLTTSDLHEAVARGVQFLVKDQNPDGSWGTGTETHGTEVYSMVPGSHDAYRLGTSALCVMALREAGEKEAHDKGLAYLLKATDARRDDGALIYNTWAHIFVTQAMAEEINEGHNTDPRVAEVARHNIKHLIQYATYVGGWNYYDFQANTQAPSMGPTSFGTAAGLVALKEARDANLEVPQRLLDLSLHRLEECRISSEAFLYGSDYKYIPRLPANKTRGAIGRTQPCNYAIRLLDPPKVTDTIARAGLDAFFANHQFLEMGRKRPIPHESWYQTAGYYYYFDHHYASRLIQTLAPESRPGYFRQLAQGVVPHQEPDGSWWDFPMWDYHKPYGTAFAVMTILRCEGKR